MTTTSTPATCKTVTLKLHPVTGRIGAIVDGVNLARPLDDATLRALRDAIVLHKVIFLRGQHDFDDASMEAFTRRLGEPIGHPSGQRVSGSESLLDLEAEAGHTAANWHTDMTFMAAYPEMTVLRALVLPPVGGDTLWSNCASACLDLPDALRGFVDGLRVVHSNDLAFQDLFDERRAERLGRYRARQMRMRQTLRAEHPLVRVHEESGERVLVLGETFASTIVGFSRRQSQQILDLVQEFVTRPENCVRWHWQIGDVAIWDNRATQHRSVGDFGEAPRHLRRSTVHGSIPVGIDGRPSRTLEAAA